MLLLKMQLIFIGILLLLFGHEQVAATTDGEDMLNDYKECAKNHKLSMKQYLEIIVGVDLDGVDNDTIVAVHKCLRYRFSPYFKKMANWGPDDFDVGDPCFLGLSMKSETKKVDSADLDKCFEEVKKLSQLRNIEPYSYKEVETHFTL